MEVSSAPEAHEFYDSLPCWKKDVSVLIFSMDEGSLPLHF